MTVARIAGRILFFNESKLYGFVVAEADGKSYFFHLNDVEGKAIPQRGQRAIFEPTETPKGLRAINLKVMEEN